MVVILFAILLEIKSVRRTRAAQRHSNYNGAIELLQDIEQSNPPDVKCSVFENSSLAALVVCPHQW